MKLHNVYEHKDWIEALIYVLRVVHVPKGIKVKVHYCLRSAVADNGFRETGVIEEILITKEQLKNWHLYTPAPFRTECIR